MQTGRARVFDCFRIGAKSRPERQDQKAVRGSGGFQFQRLKLPNILPDSTARNKWGGRGSQQLV